MKSKFDLRQKRKARIRAKITGTTARPRLSIFKSNKTLTAQVIDDTKGVTIVMAKVAGKTKAAGKDLGEKIAKLALEKKISNVVFDRSGYRFHGTVKEIADSARTGGLKI